MSSSNSTISITFKLNGDAKTFKELTANADGLKKAMEGVVSEAAQLPKGFGSQLRGMAQNLAGAAAGLVSVGAAVSVVRNAVGTIKDFSRANSELAAVMGMSKKEIADMTEAAIKLGGSSEATATEVTALQTALARLGFDKGQILQMQESVLKFSSAVGTDLASAADFAGSALRAFGLSSNYTEDLLNVMAKSTSASALSFSKLQASISTVAPVAHAFGLSARDTVAFLGALSNAGFDASSAATAFRNILLNLAKANGKLATGLGHTARTMPEIIDALEELNARGVSLSETLDMTDKKSVSAFNAFLSGTGTLRELREEVDKSNGALNEMYETMTNNLEGSLKSLSSAWERFVLQLRGSEGVLKWTTDRLTDMVGRWGDIVSGDGKTTWYEALLGPLTGSMIAGGRKRKSAGAGTPSPMPAEDTSGSTAAVAGEVEAIGDAAEKATKKTNGLSSAIQDLRKSVQGSLAVNEALNNGRDAANVQLEAMRSALTGIIAKYGLESDAVKALVDEYGELLKARRDSSRKVGPLDAVSGLGVSGVSVGKPSAIGMPEGYLKPFVDQSAIAKTRAEELQKVIGALSGTFSSFGSVLGEGASAWASWGAGVLQAIAQAIPAIATLTAAKKVEANAALEAAGAEAMSSVASVPFAGPVLALSALASIVAAALAIPKFAKGGVAYGPTLGLFGEYPGAASNPEVVAPLDSLKSMLNDTGAGGEVNFRIEADALVGVLKRRMTKVGRS